MAQSALLLIMAFISVLFVQLYRGNLLLSIVRPAVQTTPDTMEEIVEAVEAASLRLSFSKPDSLTKRTLLSPDMVEDRL